VKLSLMQGEQKVLESDPIKLDMAAWSRQEQSIV